MPTSLPTCVDEHTGHSLGAHARPDLIAVSMLTLVSTCTLGSAIALAATLSLSAADVGEHRLSWIGNSGSGAWDEERQMRLYTQMDVKEASVLPDGTVVAITWFDEGHQNIGVYKDGAFVGRMPHTYGSAALAVAANDEHIYAGTTRRVDDKRVNFVRRYDRKPPFRYHDLELSRTDGKGYQPFLGMALSQDTLIVSDRVGSCIRLIDISSMRETASFPVAGGTPRKVAVDSQQRIWVIIGGPANLDPGDQAFIRGYTFDGTPIPHAEIRDVGLPTAIAVDHRDRLLVADSTPGVNHIAIYDLASDIPKRTGTFGRCITSDVPGEVQPDKFDHITGLGSDAEGNFYVCWNGGPHRTRGGGRLVSSAQGQVIRSLTPAGALRWELLGLHFMDNADADPADDTIVYAKNERYAMDYSKPPGQEWTWQAYTLDRLRYPEDPRLWQSHMYASQMLRLDGKLFMILQDQYRDVNAMYRFDGDIAVPAIMFNGKFPWDHPPQRPKDMRKFLWRDGSGSTAPDGHFQTEEYQELRHFAWGFNSWSANGDHWNIPSAGNRIVHYPYLGLDAHGIPRYSEDSATVTNKPDIIHKLATLEYDHDRDVMFLSGFFAAEEDKDYGGGTGRTRMAWIVRYDDWSGERRLVSRMDLPKDKVMAAFTIAGDWVFAGERQGQPIHVYDSRDGSKLTVWRPGAAHGGPDWYGGGLDLDRAIRATVRPNGEILVFSEEVSYAKVLMHRWLPPR